MRGLPLAMYAAKLPSRSASAMYGLSARYWSGESAGMFTALMATPLFKYSTTCWAMRMPTISCASSVEPPMCGVASTASEAKAAWLLKIPEIIGMLEAFDVPVVDRAIVEHLFVLRRRQAIELLHRFGGFQSGRTFLVDRHVLIENLRRLAAGDRKSTR